MTRPAPFPHRYTVTLEDRRLLAPPRAAIAAGPPPQFGGTDQEWSPEELLVGAVLECLWTTFEAYARRDSLAVAGWSGTGVGVLDKGPGGPTFTAIELSIELDVDPIDQERALRILARAEKDCIISRAIRPPVTVAATIRHRAHAA